MKASLLLIMGSCMVLPVCGQAPESGLLSGAAICDSQGNSFLANAFDGDEQTLYSSLSPSHAWVGYDLTSKHVVTKVRWYNKGGKYPYHLTIGYKDPNITVDVPYCHLAVFEGANNEDFSDALPLYMVLEASDQSSWSEADIDVSRGFRYLRYVGPEGSYGQIGEVEFYGYEGEGDDSRLYQLSGIPTLVVHTNSGEDMKDKVTNLPSYANLIYKTKTGKQKIIGDLCTIRGRGNNSWQYPKKPFRIKFENKVEMPYGGAKAKKWAVVNSFGDKTLMRNTLAYDMSRRMEMEYTPYCQPVDVFLNGEYKGSYQLCDQMEVGKNRLNIDELDETWTEDQDVTGGYFYEYDGNAHSKTLSAWQALSESDKASWDVGFTTVAGSGYGKNPITIKSPDEDVMHQSQYEYLKAFIENIEFTVSSNSSKIPEVIDLESFARYFIVGEFGGNTDTFWEMYQYKKRNDPKAYFGPCWDFDLTYDNDGRTHEYLSNSESTGWTFQNGGSNKGTLKKYAESILANSETRKKLRENWSYVRASEIVSEDAILSFVNELEDDLQTSQMANFKRWPILNSYIHENYEIRDSWEDEVQVIKDFVPRRISWFDKQLQLTPNTFNLKVSDAKWATIYLPYAFKVPQNIEVYSPASIDETGRLLLDKIDTTRPNTPYLVHAEGGEYELDCYEVDATDGNAKGLLVGTTQEMSVQTGDYVLQNHDGKVGFYRVEQGSTITLKEQRAYMRLPESPVNAPKRVIFLGNGDADNIELLPLSDKGFIQVYDLTGVKRFESEALSDEKLLHNLDHGIYIINEGKTYRKIQIK